MVAKKWHYKHVIGLIHTKVTLRSDLHNLARRETSIRQGADPRLQHFELSHHTGLSMLVVNTDVQTETMGEQQYERHSNDAQPSDKVVAHHVARTSAHIPHISP